MPPSRLPGLSKSTFLMGRQCTKLLWFRYNAKDQLPAPDAGTQAVFDQGHEVGELAKQLFPGGIEIDTAPGDFDGALRRTQAALKQRRPIYEAAFAHGGGYARADILVPVAGGAWDLVEVKSTTSLKEEVHLPDIAFQAFVLTGAGNLLFAAGYNDVAPTALAKRRKNNFEVRWQAGRDPACARAKRVARPMILDDDKCHERCRTAHPA